MFGGQKKLRIAPRRFLHDIGFRLIYSSSIVITKIRRVCVKFKSVGRPGVGVIPSPPPPTSIALSFFLQTYSSERCRLMSNRYYSRVISVIGHCYNKYSPRTDYRARRTRIIHVCYNNNCTLFYGQWWPHSLRPRASRVNLVWLVRHHKLKSEITLHRSVLTDERFSELVRTAFTNDHS